MALDLTALAKTRRLLFEVELKPIQGQRFQPTGFPDLGPATYQAGGNACLLVESAQSMANRLEETIWDEGSNQPVEAAAGISYVVVNRTTKSAFLTSSILEAHRMNSPYIEKCEGEFFTEDFTKAIGVDKSMPVNRNQFLSALLKYDLNSLLHGTFLESLDGRLRIPRSLSAFIEAEHVQVVASGGVKNDRIQATKEEGRSAKDGFGNVPFHREEFTAEKITAFFSVDLQQIRAYGLGDDVTELLTVLALYKIRRLLSGDMRLRTACDLEPVADSITAKRPDGFDLPSEDDLADALKAAIKKCKDKMRETTVSYKK